MSSFKFLSLFLLITMRLTRVNSFTQNAFKRMNNRLSNNVNKGLLSTIAKTDISINNDILSKYETIESTRIEG